jgi:hypothetical protein
MKIKLLGLIASGTAWLICESTASPIHDPIADYLKMNIPDRREYIGTLDHVSSARIDVDGDGKDEVFIGAPYRYSGRMEVLWVGYEPVEGGYKRITPADEDIMIGSFEDIYAGPLAEIAKQGLATADDIEVDSPESENDQSWNATLLLSGKRQTGRGRTRTAGPGGDGAQGCV